MERKVGKREIGKRWWTVKENCKKKIMERKDDKRNYERND